MLLSGGAEAAIKVRKLYLKAMRPAQNPEASHMSMQFNLVRCMISGDVTSNFVAEDLQDYGGPDSRPLRLCAQWLSHTLQECFNIEQMTQPQTDPSADAGVLAGDKAGTPLALLAAGLRYSVGLGRACWCCAFLAAPSPS